MFNKISNLNFRLFYYNIFEKETKKKTLHKTRYLIIDRSSRELPSFPSIQRIERAIINRGVKFDKFGDETAMLERKRLSRPAREK